jgi:hypothetical protein
MNSKKRMQENRGGDSGEPGLMLGRRIEQRIIVALFTVTLIFSVSALCFTIFVSMQCPTSTALCLSLVLESLAIVGTLATAAFYLHFYYTLQQWDKED